MLSMSEQGYDTCPLEGFDSLRVKRALGLPHDCGINMVITCGVRTEGGVRGELTVCRSTSSTIRYDSYRIDSCVWHISC